jgi:hypothetical protein
MLITIYIFFLHNCTIIAMKVADKVGVRLGHNNHCKEEMSIEVNSILQV